MKITGHGTGDSAEEARANAKADLTDKMAAVKAGQWAGLTFAGTFQVVLTALNQFFIRPIPALIVGAGCYVLGLIGTMLFSVAFPGPSFAAIATLIGMLITAGFLLPTFAHLFKQACLFVEGFERPIVLGLPDPVRIAVVALSAFFPTIIFAVLALQGLQSSSPADASDGLFFNFVFFGIFQVIVFIARQRSGEIYGDYDWLGRRLPGQAEVTADRAPDA